MLRLVQIVSKIEVEIGDLDIIIDMVNKNMDEEWYKASPDRRPKFIIRYIDKQSGNLIILYTDNEIEFNRIMESRFILYDIHMSYANYGMQL